MNIIDQLRDVLVPNGESDIILLRAGPYGFIDSDTMEVDAILNELERKMIVWEGGLDTPSPLEKLAVRLLFKSLG